MIRNYEKPVWTMSHTHKLQPDIIYELYNKILIKYNIIYELY